MDYHHEDTSDSEPFLDQELSAQQEPKILTCTHMGRFTIATLKTVLYTLCAHLLPGALVTLLVLSLFSKSPLGSGDEINGIVPASK